MKITEANFLDVVTRRIKEARTASGFDQEEMAVILGIPRTSFCRIESGKRNITLFEAYQLSVFFEMGMDELLGLNSQDWPPSSAR